MHRHQSYSPKHNKGRSWYDPRKLLGKCLSEFINAVTHFAPLNATSRLFGKAVRTEYLPACVHHAVIRSLIWLYGIPLHEYTPDTIEAYRTTQDFFVRCVKPECRPLDTGAIVTSPADAEVLQTGEVRGHDMVVEQVHVKGFTYNLETLLQVRLPPTRDGEKRVYVVLHLRPGDYHRFHCPMDMTVKATVHMPGALLPVTSMAMKWVPRLLVSNERVVIQSDRCVVTAIGATNVGSVRLPWEAAIATNVSRRKRAKFAVHRRYADGASFKGGDELGFFEFGSCIVLVMDVPVAAECVVLVERRA